MTTSRSPGVVELVMDDPERLNPIGDAFWADLERTVAELHRSPDVRIVTLTGRGRAFSAGGDVRRMRDLASAAEGGRLDDTTLAVERERLERAHAVLRDWVALPAVRIAVVNGPAVGAGLSLAMTCDFRVMSTDAWLDTAFARLGLPGDCGITYFLPRLIGDHRSGAWLQRPRRVAAEEALDLGLVDEIAAPGRMDAAVHTLVGDLTSGSPDASAWVRRPSEVARALEPFLERELEATLACKATAFYGAAVSSFGREAPS